MKPPIEYRPKHRASNDFTEVFRKLEDRIVEGRDDPIPGRTAEEILARRRNSDADRARRYRAKNAGK